MKIKQKILAVLLVCGGQACIAQGVSPEVFASAGGCGNNSQGSLSWTIGESVVSTESSTNCYLTQGFQQPPAITVTAVNNLPEKNLVKVYPNPVSSSVYVQGTGNGTLQIQLMDMNGKLIMSKLLSSSENQLDLTSYASGVYLLKVYDLQNQLIESLKIEKVN